MKPQNLYFPTLVKAFCQSLKKRLPLSNYNLEILQRFTCEQSRRHSISYLHSLMCYAGQEARETINQEKSVSVLVGTWMSRQTQFDLEEMEMAIELITMELQLPNHSLESIIVVLSSIACHVQMFPLSQAFKKMNDCLLVFYQMHPQEFRLLVDQKAFAEVLAGDMSKIEEFLSYFSENTNRSLDIFRILLKGFLQRASKIQKQKTFDHIQKTLLGQVYRRVLYQIGSVDVLPAILMEEFEQFFELLIQFQCRSLSCAPDGSLINHLFKVYAKNQRIQKFQKYQFMLNLIKQIIQRYQSIFPLVDVSFISKDTDFLRWVVSTELLESRSRQIAQDYLLNSRGIHFLLHIMLCGFEELNDENFVQKMSSLMRIVGLKDEIKYHTHNQDIRMCIGIFYETTRQMEVFDEIVSSEEAVEYMNIEV